MDGPCILHDYVFQEISYIFVNLPFMKVMFIVFSPFPQDPMQADYTGWPRKNATTLIVNFKEIINKPELIFILLCGKFIFQQNDTMIINFG